MIKTFDDVLHFLDDHPSKGYSRVQLDAYLTIHPLRFTRPAIHLTGSNGKGSTATMIASIYEASGLRVGLFTSPALDHYTDMIRINHEAIPEAFVIQFFQNHGQAMDASQLTSFEMTTLCAYAYFEHEIVDLAVIEVGMGGTIDATNIITPILSLITNVSLEHVDVLGPTITHITHHKAGIIKPNVPVLIGPLVDEARKVVAEKVQQTQSPLFETLPYTYTAEAGLTIGPYRNVHLRLKGPYQHANAALAIQAVSLLQSRFPLTENAIREGLEQAFIPGRLEIMQTDPTILIDAGHNPDGIRVLVEAMKAYNDKEIDVLFAAFKDKDVNPMLTLLSSIASSITLTTFDHPRARKKEDYSTSFMFEEAYDKVLNHFIQNASSNRVLLITGSLAFVGLIRQRFIKKRV